METVFEYDSEGSIEEYREYWLDENGLSDEEVINRMANDDMYFEHMFNELVHAIETELDALGSSDVYFVSGQNISWQGLSGERMFAWADGSELVQTLTPDNGAFNMKVSRTSDSLSIVVGHHDAREVFTVSAVPDDVEDVYYEEGETAAIEAL